MCVVAHRSLSLRLVRQLTAAAIAVAILALAARSPAMAAAAATLACAIAACGAPPSRVAASRMHGQRLQCRRPRDAGRFLLFALP
ncbi:hypothetical protein [Burkholderia sp. Bp8998]|uniref:hypothetical protein n=1 Tax=Burkholderia sp. Bp8998 TaxID=2184557 RepID=UPI0021AB4310|nr:hypothetical protein [Burkholderia sp. Bp8998]